MRDLQEKPALFLPRKKGSGLAKKSSLFSAWDLRLFLVGFFLARAMPVLGVCPFGLALLSLVPANLSLGLPALLGVCLGYASFAKAFSLWYIGASLLLFGLQLSLPHAPSLKSNLLRALFSVFFARLFSLLFLPFSFWMLAQTLLDAGLISLCVPAFARLSSLWEGRHRRKDPFSLTDSLCLCLALSLILFAARSIPLPFAFSLANSLGLFLIGLVATVFGPVSGAVAGLVTGLLLGLYQDVLFSLAMTVPCGLLCGILPNRHRMLAALILLLWGVPCLLLGIFLRQEGVLLQELLLAALCLGFLPEKVFFSLTKWLSFCRLGKTDCPLCDRLNTELQETAHAFDTLADSLVEAAKAKPDSAFDIPYILDRTKDRLCARCSAFAECWHTRHTATYKGMVQLLKCLSLRDDLTESDLCLYFPNGCLHPRSLLRELCRQYDQGKLQMAWVHKQWELKGLLSGQFHGTAEIFHQFSARTEERCAHFALTEEQLLYHLRAARFPIDRVRFLPSGKGRITLELTLFYPMAQDKLLSLCALIKKVLGLSFSPHTAHMGTRTVTLFEAPPLSVTYGFATRHKEDPSGDCHRMHFLHGGKFLAMLSDGMGCGRPAFEESSVTVQLLDMLLSAGFDKAVAVRLMNSVLMMNARQESFSTVDLCILDLFSGQAEFVKNGAEPSYICRRNGTETIRAAALPVGMLPQMEVAAFAHKVTAGDTIVMCSDGLCLKESTEDPVRRLLDRAACQLPVQELADRLIEAVLKETDNQVPDDMTVLVLRLVKS